MSSRPPDPPVLHTTILTVAADQIATAAIDRSMDAMQAALSDMGFTEVEAEDAEALPCWDAVREDLEDMIREVWRRRAEQTERAMRAEGIDPEAAAMKVPEGVVPS